jgi:anti-sigma factor RsiW
MTRIEQSGASGGNAVAEKRIDLACRAFSPTRAPRAAVMTSPPVQTPEWLTGEAHCVKLKAGDGARKALR